MSQTTGTIHTKHVTMIGCLLHMYGVPFYYPEFVICVIVICD